MVGEFGWPTQRALLAPLLAVAFLIGCGGGSTEDGSKHPLLVEARPAPSTFPIQSTPTVVRMKMLAASPKRLPTADELFDWAEKTYPQFFPSRQTTQALQPYLYRFYPESGNYVGLTGESIVILGPISGGQVVTVGTLSEYACQVVPATCNSAPIASAGMPSSVTVGTLVTLDGASSSDADGDQLAFEWSLTSKPNGSTAQLSSTTAIRPTITPDVAGTYIAKLVVKDAFVSSEPATVTVAAATANAAPVASAGASQSVVVGSVVVLDGTASSDANGDPLQYRWTLTTSPAGSAAVLAGATTARPTFTADRSGTFTASLTVSDGRLTSLPATVLVTAAVLNSPPVANAGPSQAVTAGDVVTLNGTRSSDPNGDPLVYQWAFVSRPANSVARLSNTAASSPTFVADLPGTYVVALAVGDGSLVSPISTVTIAAVAPNLAPVANAGLPQTVSAGSIVTLNGAGSSDPNGDPLIYQWAFASRPTASQAVLVASTSRNPTFLADVAGTYVVALAVGDGKLASQVATVTITVLAPSSGTVHLLLYGGTNYRDYLGCLTCNSFHIESVCNQFGTYGNQFASASIWNEFGTYGGRFNTFSPWNEFSFNGPGIWDTNGLFYGYFTVNQFRAERTTVPFALQTLNFYASTGNFSRTRTFLCGS